MKLVYALCLLLISPLVLVMYGIYKQMMQEPKSAPQRRTLTDSAPVSDAEAIMPSLSAHK
jgi:hypothetical protein